MTDMSPDYMRDFDREMLRAQFASLFSAVIIENKKAKGKFTFKEISDRLGVHKSAISRWFKLPPNWTLNKVSDVASALDLEIRVEATLRETGQIFTAQGIRPAAVTSTESSAVQPVRTLDVATASAPPPTVIKFRTAA